MAEPTSAALGPRYAPDDPTLPKPWKGLIDGSTGLSYYWNPETNVTQYEKPVATSPPMPLAPIPGGHSVLSNGVTAQIGQQISQGSQHEGQKMSHLSQHPYPVAQQQSSMAVQVPHQEGLQITQALQHHGLHSSQAMHQPGQLQQHKQHMMQYQGQQTLQNTNQHLSQPPNLQALQHSGQIISQQSASQIPHQISPSQGLPMGQHQGQYAHQQFQYMAYQPNVVPKIQQNSQQQVHHNVQGQPFANQQEYMTTNSKKEEDDFQHGNQVVFSPSQYQQTGISSANNVHAGTNSIPMQKFGAPSGQAPKFGVPPAGVQQTPPMTQLQATGLDFMPQHLPKFQNQMNPALMHGQQAGVPPNDMKMENEENMSGRVGNEYCASGNKNVPAVSIQQPKLATVPMGRSHQEMRMSGVPFQNTMPGQSSGLNAVAGYSLQNVYSQGMGGQPLPNNSQMRLSIGSSDVTIMSPVENYCKQHEVTTTGDNVPAPFITFEATGFPPEILKEEEQMSYAALLLVHLHMQQWPCLEAAKWMVGAYLGHFLEGCWLFDQITPDVTEMSCLLALLLCLYDHLLLPKVAYIYAAGFSSPTPIQAQTWPIALQGRDILAIAKTGSGKTLGYLIPAFILLRQRHNNPQNGPTVLVLSPTRELATQIQDEAIKFGRSSRVSCTCLYGGAPKGPQLKELDRGADIVVATPGRLNDILEMKMINFRQISLLVLDEADRMLDMGFEPQIRKIVNETPPRRQTLMYTATWPKEVRKIAGDLLVNPVQVNIGSVDLSANKAITQFVEMVPQMEKQNRLEQILRSQERGSKVIIFCSTKRLCDHLARCLGRSFGAAAIHGDKSQGERDWVLNQFRNGKSPILVATDVAARGLDIKDIRVVINYDFPTGVEDYVHRIGRTGRAGATGVSYTFFSDQDWKYAADLIKVLEGANQQVPPEVREMAMRGGPSFGKDRGGMNRFDPSSGGGRWDSTGGGRMRDGGFGGRGGMRDGGFSGRGGMRDGGFSGRGGMKDGFGDRGGRNDFFPGRGNRGRGFGGPMGGGHVGWSRNDNGGPNNWYNNIDGRGRGRGRGQGRFDNRRDISDRSRGRSYSRSPERVRTWGYSRSRSSSRSSRSWSRSRSRSQSRSRSRSWSRGHNRNRSRSRSRSRGHNRSRSRSRNRSLSLERPQAHNIDKENSKSPKLGTTSESESAMFTKPPVKDGNSVLETSDVGQLPVIESAAPGYPETAVDGAETVINS